MRSGLRAAVFLACLLRMAAAQEAVRIEFAPPPMDGTISLGVYDAKGKLVRVLHREAPVSDFKVGVNGLITSWDGKNDSGAQAAPGKYSGRGYTVGEFQVEGVAFHFNDWISEDAPIRVRRIRDMCVLPEGDLALTAEAGGKAVLFRCAAAGKIVWTTPLPEGIDGQGVSLDGTSILVSGKRYDAANGTPGGDSPPAQARQPALPFLSGSSQALDVSAGNDRNLWVIVRDAGNVDVREYTLAGEFRRHLAIKPGEPPPVKIRASATADEVFLLEQDEKEQRVRGLALAAGAGASGVSTWKIIFEKTILFSDRLGDVKDQLKGPDGKLFAPQEKIKLPLPPNPLNADQTPVLQAGVAVDKAGSFLQTPDGLPLRHLTETAGLRWAAFERAPEGILLFQSDGAVVEEFKAGRLGNMMSFDCGDFDYKPR